MPTNYPGRINFGLLPEPEGRSGSFVTATVINLMILAAVLYIGMMAKHVIEQHKYEQTELIFPTTPPPQPKVKVPPPPKLPEPPKPAEVKLEAPKINLPKPEPKPALKPIEIEAKVNTPQLKAAKPSIILAPQPKAALKAAARAVTPQEHPSTAPVHFGDLHGVTPNPTASKPATVAAIGNPYGGNAGSRSCSARSGRVHRHRQRHQIRIKRRYCRQGGVGGHSRCCNDRPVIFGRQGGLGRYTCRDHRMPLSPRRPSHSPYLQILKCCQNRRCNIPVKHVS